jgi:hypothetical protein
MELLFFFIFNLGYLVDLPSTYILSQGSYGIEVRVGGSGKIIGKIGVSPFESFAIGVSYGGEKIIGSGTPKYNSSPGVQIKWGMSTMKFSTAIGYDSEVYENSATGIYGVVGGSLGWKVIPYIGVCYSDSLKGFCGIEIGVFPSISISGEGLIEKNKFTLNSGVRWKFGEQVIFEFNFKDILGKDVIRSIKFSYIEYI